MWHSVEFGDVDSLQYQELFLEKEGSEFSSWHDIALRAGDSGLVNFVCLTTQGRRGECQVAEGEPDTPIRLQHPSEWPGHEVDTAFRWKSGFLPQTWTEGPRAHGEGEGANSEGSNYRGAPLEVLVLSSRTAAIGEVQPVKLLGAFPTISGDGNLSWKLVGVAADDERFLRLSSMQQLQTSFPNAVEAVRCRLGTGQRDAAEGEGDRQLANGGGRPMGAEWAQQVVADGHARWQSWIMEQEPRAAWSLPPGAEPQNAAEYQALWPQLMPRLDPNASPSEAEVTPGPASEVHLERAWADSSETDKWEGQSKKGDAGMRSRRVGRGGHGGEKGKIKPAMVEASKKVSTFLKSLTKSFRPTQASRVPQVKIYPKHEASNAGRPTGVRSRTTSRTEDWFETWRNGSMGDGEPAGKDEGGGERSPCFHPARNVSPLPGTRSGYRYGHQRSASYSTAESAGPDSPMAQQDSSGLRRTQSPISCSSSHRRCPDSPGQVQQARHAVSQPQSGHLEPRDHWEKQQAQRAASASPSPPHGEALSTADCGQDSRPAPERTDPATSTFPVFVRQLSFTDIESLSRPDPRTPSTQLPWRSLIAPKPSAAMPGVGDLQIQAESEPVVLTVKKVGLSSAAPSEDKPGAVAAEEPPLAAGKMGLARGVTPAEKLSAAPLPDGGSGSDLVLQSDVDLQMNSSRVEGWSQTGEASSEALAPAPSPRAKPKPVSGSASAPGLQVHPGLNAADATEGASRTGDKVSPGLRNEETIFPAMDGGPLPELDVVRPPFPAILLRSPTGARRSPPGIPKSPTGTPRSPPACLGAPHSSSPVWRPGLPWGGEGFVKSTDGGQSDTPQDQIKWGLLRTQTFQTPARPASPDSWRSLAEFRRTNSDGLSSAGSSDSSGFSPTSILDLRNGEHVRSRLVVKTKSRVVTTKGFDERRKEQVQRMREELIELEALAAAKSASE